MRGLLQKADQCRGSVRLGAQPYKDRAAAVLSLAARSFSVQAASAPCQLYRVRAGRMQQCCAASSPRRRACQRATAPPRRSWGGGRVGGERVSHCTLDYMFCRPAATVRFERGPQLLPPKGGERAGAGGKEKVSYCTTDYMYCCLVACLTTAVSYFNQYPSRASIYHNCIISYSNSRAVVLPPSHLLV